MRKPRSVPAAKQPASWLKETCSSSFVVVFARFIDAMARRRAAATFLQHSKKKKKKLSLAKKDPRAPGVRASRRCSPLRHHTCSCLHIFPHH
jgi:hypothetical protein